LSAPIESAAPATPGRRVAALLLGIAVSAGLLWWAMRGLHPGDVVRTVRAAPPLPLLLAVLVATLVFPLRALRWRLLLREPDGASLRGRAAWTSITIGYAGNNLLPFRAGEVLRAYAASRLAPVRMSSAFASVAVERVFDALTVVASFGLALFTSGMSTSVRIGGMALPDVARRVGILTAVAVIAAAAILTRADAAGRLISRVVPWPGVSSKLVTLLHGIREGLTALKSPARLGAVILWSIAIWAVNALSFQLLFPAFGIEVGYAGAVIVQSAIVFGIAVPSSPGFIGVFEAAIVVALALYGVPQDRAVAYALTYHAATFLPITALGLYAAYRTGLGWRTTPGTHD
jgi:uncharacterized protein (TIRG00374 family)